MTRFDLKVPMRDGAQLSASLYLPELRHQQAPAIFALTAYTADWHHNHARYFAARGYPFLTVDVRGRGNSDGVFHPFGESDGGHGQDGCDISEWLASQPYCDGKVAMWGGSFLGYTQWATARERPRQLATIVPVAAPFRGVDSPIHNNLFRPYTLRWLSLLAGRTVQSKLFADQLFWNRQFKRWFESGLSFRQLDTFVGYPSDVFQEWMSHSMRDAYWDGYNPTAEQYSQVTLPVLTITGAYDGNQLGALEHYRQHQQHTSPQARARHYLVIGPWDHAGCGMPTEEFGGLRLGSQSLLDLRQLHFEWFAWTMQHGPRPPFLKDNVAYYVTGTEEWRYAHTLKGATAGSTCLYLQSDRNATDVFQSGRLSCSEPPRGQPDWYTYDPRDVSLAGLESSLDLDSLVDQRMLFASVGKKLVYHSEPFEQDREVVGFFSLSLWLAIDQPDTDFLVTVHDIGLDGSSLLLATDALRARYRESLRMEKLICTTAPLRYDFTRFNFIARRIRRGHRLRLVVGPINSIHCQKNYNSGGCVCDESVKDARPVTVRLYHDHAHPSALAVPLGTAD